MSTEQICCQACGLGLSQTNLIALNTFECPACKSLNVLTKDNVRLLPQIPRQVTVPEEPPVEKKEQNDPWSIILDLNSFVYIVLLIWALLSVNPVLKSIVLTMLYIAVTTWPFFVAEIEYEPDFGSLIYVCAVIGIFIAAFYVCSGLTGLWFVDLVAGIIIGSLLDLLAVLPARVIYSLKYKS